MRIAILARQLGGNFGTERVVALSLKLLQSAGHNVFTVVEECSAAGAGEVISDLFSTNLLTPPSAIWAKRSQLGKSLSSFGPDIVHLTGELDSRIVGSVISRYPTVLTSHTVATTSPSSCRVIETDKICEKKSGWGCLLHHKKYGCLSYLKSDLRRIHALYEYQSRRKSHQKVHAVLGPSRYICDLLEFDGWPKQKIRKVVNPVPVPTITPLKGAPKNLLSTASRLVPMKGIDRLLQALVLISHLQWTLWICGDGPERESLTQLANELKLSHRVVFKGTTDHAFTLSIIAASQIYLQPNLGPESFGMAAAEASALAVPIVGFDVPGLNETVINGQTGILVKNIDELGRAIAELLTKPERAAQLGGSGKHHVLSSFSESAHLEATLSSYESARSTFRAS